MWEFREGSVFAPRTFISYGALLGYAAFYAEEILGEHHGTAAGWFLIVLAIFTTPSWSRHYERQRVLAFLDLAVALLLLGFGAKLGAARQGFGERCRLVPAGSRGTHSARARFTSVGWGTGWLGGAN